LFPHEHWRVNFVRSSFMDDIYITKLIARINV